MSEPSRNRACPCGSGKKYKLCCAQRDHVSPSPAAGFQQIKTVTMPKRDEDMLIVAMPTRGTVSVETHLALSANMDGLARCNLSVPRKPVVEARNELAAWIRKVAKERPWGWVPRETYVLWVDDDAWWAPTCVKTALSALRDLPAIDLLAGWFGGRNEYCHAFAYRRVGDGESYPRPGKDCSPGEIVEVARIGFHFVLHRASLLERVGDDPFTIPEGSGANISEDFAFCDRVRAAGGRIGVATAIPIAHVDPKDGAAYFVGMPATEIRGNAVVRTTAEHRTLAGDVKLPDSRTYGLTEMERITAEGEAKDPKRAAGGTA